MKKVLGMLFGFSILTVFAAELPTYKNTIFTHTENKQARQAVLHTVYHSGILLDDPILDSYLQALVAKLTTAELLVLVLREHEVNAFATPGGCIFINTGLIQATQSESELAAVLAHEIAHIIQHHLERTMAQAQELNLTTAAALATAIVLGSKNNAAGTGLMMGAMAGEVQQMLKYSREYEAEADRVGIRILYQAGFDPYAMPKFFAKLRRLGHEQLPPYLITHPVTSARMADTYNRIEQYPPKTTKDSAAFGVIKARLTSKTPPKGEDVLDQLLLAETAAKPQQVLTLLAPLLNTKPYSAPITLQYSQALLATNQYTEASRLLKQEIANTKSATMLVRLYNLLAAVEAKRNNLVTAYYYKAKRYILTSDTKRAILLLEQALNLPNASNYDKVMLRIELDKLNKE